MAYYCGSKVLSLCYVDSWGLFFHRRGFVLLKFIYIYSRSVHQLQTLVSCFALCVICCRYYCWNLKLRNLYSVMGCCVTYTQTENIYAGRSMVANYVTRPCCTSAILRVACTGNYCVRSIDIFDIPGLITEWWRGILGVHRHGAWDYMFRI